MNELVEGAVNLEVRAEQGLPTLGEYQSAVAGGHRALRAAQEAGELVLDYTDVLDNLDNAAIARARQRAGENDCFYHTSGSEAGKWQLSVQPEEDADQKEEIEPESETEETTTEAEPEVVEKSGAEATEEEGQPEEEIEPEAVEPELEETPKSLTGNTRDVIPAFLLAMEEMTDNSQAQQHLETLKACTEFQIPGDGDEEAGKIINYEDWQRLIQDGAVELAKQEGVAENWSELSVLPEEKRKLLLEAQQEIGGRVITRVTKDKVPEPEQSETREMFDVEGVDQVLAEGVNFLTTAEMIEEATQILPTLLAKEDNAGFLIRRRGFVKLRELITESEKLRKKIGEGKIENIFEKGGKLSEFDEQLRLLEEHIENQGITEDLIKNNIKKELEAYLGGHDASEAFKLIEQDRVSALEIAALAQVIPLIPIKDGARARFIKEAATGEVGNFVKLLGDNANAQELLLRGIAGKVGLGQINSAAELRALFRKHRIEPALEERMIANIEEMIKKDPEKAKGENNWWMILLFSLPTLQSLIAEADAELKGGR